jgi:O-antigen ligase
MSSVAKINSHHSDKMFSKDINYPFVVGVVIINLFCVLCAVVFGLKAIVVCFALAMLYFMVNIKNFPIVSFFIFMPLFLLISEKYLSFYFGGFEFLMIALWLMQNPNIPIKNHTINQTLFFLVLTFLFVAIVSLIYNGIPGAGVIIIAKYLLFFVFIFAFYYQFNSKDALLIFTAITVLSIIISVPMIKSYIGTKGLLAIIEMYRAKPGALQINSNVLGGLIVGVLPFWMALSFSHEYQKLRLIALILSIILIVSLIFTNSRSSLLGFCLAIIFIFSWRRKLRYIVGILAMIGFIVLLYPQIWKIILLGSRMDSGTSFRTIAWGFIIIMIAQNPIVGVSLGGFNSAFQHYLTTSWESNLLKSLVHGHNFVLDLTAKIGFTGFILVILLYYLPIKNGIKAYSQMKLPFDKIVTIGIIASIVATYGYSVFENGGILGDGGSILEIVFWIKFCMLLKLANLKIDGIKSIYI